MLVEKLKNAFIVVTQPIEWDKPKSYINRNDLIEVLQDYYNGLLDEPRDSSKINQPLHEWHPNSLWCEIDSTTLRSCLKRIARSQRIALRYSITGSVESYDAIGQCYILAEETPAKLDEYIENCFDDGIERLSELLIEVL